MTITKQQLLEMIDKHLPDDATIIGWYPESNELLVIDMNEVFAATEGDDELSDSGASYVMVL